MPSGGENGQLSIGAITLSTQDMTCIKKIIKEIIEK